MRNSIRRVLFPLLAAAVMIASDSAAEDPASQLKVSYTQRIRIETTDNVTQLDYDSLAGSSYMRNRTTLGAQFYPSHGWELAARLVNEFRYYFVPERKQFTLDEVVFDQLYAKRDSAFGVPLTIIAGRQNIMLGEGFVVAEGGPLDGSRTAYFNGVNLRWNFAPDHWFSLIYVYQPRYDDWLPIIHDQKRAMVESREQALIGYYAKTGTTISPQVYMIYKHIHDRSSDIVCAGARLQAALTSRLTLTSELAGQFGTRWYTSIMEGGQPWWWFRDADQLSYGGYSYLEVKTGWPLYYPQAFTVGGLILSGDDPQTAEYEGWEPMFSRYPKWSESYPYTLTREGGVAYWTNLGSVFARTTVKLGEDLTLALDYHHLLAARRGDIGWTARGGRDRGNLYIGRLTYKANAHLSGHVIWESFEPGDYYLPGADHYSWMRMEALIAF